MSLWGHPHLNHREGKGIRGFSPPGVRPAACVLDLSLQVTAAQPLQVAYRGTFSVTTTGCSLLPVLDPSGV